MAVEKKTVDKRIFDRNFSRGLVPKAEVDKFIKTLPDDAASATWVVIDPEDPEVSNTSNGVE